MRGPGVTAVGVEPRDESVDVPRRGDPDVRCRGGAEPHRSRETCPRRRTICRGDRSRRRAVANRDVPYRPAVLGQQVAPAAMTASQSGELRLQFAYPTAHTALVQALALLQLNSVFAMAQDRSPQPAQSMSVPSFVSDPGAEVQSAKAGSEHWRTPVWPPLPPVPEAPPPPMPDSPPVIPAPPPATRRPAADASGRSGRPTGSAAARTGRPAPASAGPGNTGSPDRHHRLVASTGHRSNCTQRRPTRSAAGAQIVGRGA